MNDPEKKEKKDEFLHPCEACYQKLPKGAFVISISCEFCNPDFEKKKENSKAKP